MIIFNKILVVISGHNEVYKIGRSLESIRWAIENIIVDCQSTDNLVEICRNPNIFYE